MAEIPLIGAAACQRQVKVSERIKKLIEFHTVARSTAARQNIPCKLVGAKRRSRFSGAAGSFNNFLFICLGNICRSPFAEGLFAKLVAQEKLGALKTQSAGLIALPGNSATYMAQQVAEEYAVDLTEHKAQPVSKDLVNWSDLIMVMEKSHQDSLFTQFPETADKIRLIRHYARYGSRNRGIADPYGLDYEAYRFCFLDIEDAVAGLIKSLT